MAVSLVSDPTLAGFNCYISLAAANEYHQTRLHNDAWTNASATEKMKALIWASRMLDTLQWRGVRTVATQAKEFPRTGLYVMSGYMLDELSIPQFLKETTAELAFWLLDQDSTAPAGTEGFSQIRVDVIDIKIDKSSKASWLNDAVRNLCWRFLVSNSKFNAPTQRVG